MPSYDVTYLTEHKITIWVPESADNATKTQLALDHVALQTCVGETSKILSCVPTPPLSDLTQQILDSISHLKPKPQK